MMTFFSRWPILMKIVSHIVTFSSFFSFHTIPDPSRAPVREKRAPVRESVPLWAPSNRPCLWQMTKKRSSEILGDN